MPETRVLGIEGTAWNFSAAVFDEDLVCLHSSPYVPPHGGIHPQPRRVFLLILTAGNRKESR